MPYANPETQKRRYKTNPFVFFSRLYQNQITSSKRRNHVLPSYTKSELFAWLSMQPHLTKLWDDWQNSNHKRSLAPSIDRLDDTKPYSLQNIRLVTWAENMAKSKIDVREGRLNNGLTASKPIKQLSKDRSKVIATFPSSNAAAESLPNASGANIRSAANGNLKTSAGFAWEFV